MEKVDLPISQRGQKVIQGTDEKAFRALIRAMGSKITDQRILILKILHSGLVHITAQELFEKVAERDSSIGFATVYRFLRSLAGFGYLTEVRIGGLPARYEIHSGGHHDHLTCTQCGKICEFENHKIEDLQIEVARKLGFELTSHVLELYGICSDCQRQKPSGKISGLAGNS